MLGKTALYLAACNNQDPMVNALLQAGSNINHQKANSQINKLGNSPNTTNPKRVVHEAAALNASTAANREPLKPRDDRGAILTRGRAPIVTRIDKIKALCCIGFQKIVLNVGNRAW